MNKPASATEHDSSVHSRSSYSPAWFGALGARLRQAARGFREGVRHHETVAKVSEVDESAPGDAQALWQLELHALSATVATLRAELQVSRAQEKRSRYCALHDDLTGLPNRRYLRERVGAALRRSDDAPPTPFSLLVLDLNGFKTLNDAYGQVTGDQLLKIVGARLLGALRAEDLVSRVGGDEFACLVPGVSRRVHLQTIATRLSEAVSSPCAVDSEVFTICPSIGIATCPTAGTTMEALMEAADGAMYAAKQTGSVFSLAGPRHRASSLYIVPSRTPKGQTPRSEIESLR